VDSMKAEINARGILTIKPLTELEAYALSKWVKDYFNENRTETLLVVHSIKDGKAK